MKKAVMLELFSENKNELSRIYGKLLTRKNCSIQVFRVVIPFSGWIPLLKIDV